MTDPLTQNICMCKSLWECVYYVYCIAMVLWSGRANFEKTAQTS